MHLRALLASCVLGACHAAAPLASPDGGVCPSASAPSEGIIATTSGRLHGTPTDSGWTWKGIPYAAPPVGDLRWRAPRPLACTTADREATRYGVACEQVDESGKAFGSEDCLTLDIWAPAPTQTSRPVLVFVHGGNDYEGAASDPRGTGGYYDGAMLSSLGDVVVVTIQYRLAAFGFLALPALAAEDPNGSTGNYGTLDQIAALAWVNTNIAAFGGDPARVLVFGQSAGAIDTCVLVASPPARGLFQRAVMHSGDCFTTPTDGARATGSAVVSHLGCASTMDPVACLRAAAADDVARVPGGSDAYPDPSGVASFYPTVDGYVLHGEPMDVMASAHHNAMPVIMGTTANEYGALADYVVGAPVVTEADYAQAVSTLYGAQLAAAILAQYPSDAYPSPHAAFVALLNDQLMQCPTRKAMRALAKGQSQPIGRFLFSHVDSNGPFAASGASHASDLPYVFGTFAAFGQAADADELFLSLEMIAEWASFADTGELPSGWPAYDPATDPYRIFDTPLGTGEAIDAQRCDFWDTLE